VRKLITGERPGARRNGDAVAFMAGLADVELPNQSNGRIS
jgi:hypothetical protein